jgi:hypothetical protein
LEVGSVIAIISKGNVKSKLSAPEAKIDQQRSAALDILAQCSIHKLNIEDAKKLRRQQKRGSSDTPV